MSQPRSPVRLVVVVGRQGRLARRLGAILLRLGVLLTSRDHPVGDYSGVPIAVYYESLERLNSLVLSLPAARKAPLRFVLSLLDDESLVRLQRQLFLRHFTDEWAFARMVAHAYPAVRRLDFTVANPRWRGLRLRRQALVRAALSVARIGRELLRLLRAGNPAPPEGARPAVLWGGAVDIEMEDDPARLSLPRFLRQVAQHLGVPYERLWVIGYKIPRAPSLRVPGEGCVPTRRALGVLLEACAAAARIAFSLGRHGLRNLALAESAQYAVSRYWLGVWKPSCVVGTISDLANDSHYVVAARMSGTAACLVSYASLNVPCADGQVWDDLEPGYRYSLYSHYIVWGECTARLFRRYAGEHAQVIVTGPVMFATDAAVPGDDGPRRGFRVGVFDISPHSGKLLAVIGAGGGWYSVEDVRRFYRDIVDALNALPLSDVEIVVKPKRPSTGRHVADGYAEMLEALDQHTSARVSYSPSSANPWEVLASLDACVSMPFTSTTSAALALGVPSVFYAPSPTVQAGRHTMDGDKLVRSKRELAAWFLETYSHRHQAQRRHYSGSRRLAEAFRLIASAGPGVPAAPQPTTVR
ncbi:MAG: hypothetical protein HY660_18435 [Armatimonadetes bacterium]|nr:hypothetical protein [Armatimonadota bacterium]